MRATKDRMARLGLHSHPIVQAILMLCAWAPSSGAQAQSSLPPSASVEILRPLVVENEQDLDLGRVTVAGEGGTVEIAPDGVRTCSAALSCSGEATPAIFRLAGSGESVALSVRFAQRLVGPNNSQIPARLSLPMTELVLSEQGTYVPIGAIVEISSDQPVGSYAGKFDITLSYQ